MAKPAGPRLVSDDAGGPWPITPQVLLAADAPQAPSAEAVARQLEAVQQEMDNLRSELNVLRRRDETLNFYMHRLDEELRLAARLQQDFLPKSLPQLGPVYFHTLFRPAGYVSGDLYDVMRLDERRIGFYVADAVGHGMPAALLTMFLKHALVTKQVLDGGYRLLSPSEAMSRLNQELIDQNLSQAAFATALYGIVDVDTLQVSIARAGHPSPLVLRADGSLQACEADGPLLGIFADEPFSECRTTLGPGDRLLLYTDGLEVAFADDPSSESSRWRAELVAAATLPTDQLLTSLSERLDQESGSLEPKDDLTVVVLEVRA